MCTCAHMLTHTRIERDVEREREGERAQETHHVHNTMRTPIWLLACFLDVPDTTEPLG